jgi:hypothetical protein
MRCRTFWAVVSFVAGCSNAPANSPFVVDGGPSDAMSDLTPYDAVDDNGIPLGRPCVDDRQCNDAIECTFDTCLRALGRCQNVPDDSRCQNGLFCDGLEICDHELGCRRGQTTTCSDEKTCTIDRCVEENKTCEHVDRDADGDGNPDGHCVTGGDCDDNDPTVFTGHPEICGNRKDDNCDGQIDETPCQSPSHDTCLDPLVVSGSGVFELDTTAAAFDYGGTCAPMDPGARRDVVIALQIGEARDVDVVAEAPAGVLAVGLAGECGKLATEMACAAYQPGPLGNSLARLRARNLAAGTYPLYVWSDRDEKIVVHVTEGPPSAPPANETCGTAAPITPGQPLIASLTGTAKDISSRCGFKTGDLVYAFTLSEAKDVLALATSLDGYGTPVVSLRRAACARPEDEIACGSGAEARAFGRALAPGAYDIGVSASAPTETRVELVVSPLTTPPPDERCDTAPRLEPNRALSISLQGHTDDLEFECSDKGAIDASYDLELDVASDLLLVLRLSSGDIGAVALARATCELPALACAKEGSGPVRAAARNVQAGSYRAVVESRSGTPVQLTALVRPALPPTIVPFADTCATAPTIDERGGFFQGITANAQPDYSASCDSAGSGPGAPDQMLKLVLTAQRRVFFDMQGSTYFTLLDVRKGDACPGAEIPQGCSAGYVAQRSFLDLTLDAGVYWVQVDGFSGDQGTWFLDVHVVDP